jgi:hypothetical protein
LRRISLADHKSSLIGFGVKLGGIVGAMGEKKSKKTFRDSKPQDRIGRRISRAISITGVPKRFVELTVLSIHIKSEFLCRKYRIPTSMNSQSNDHCQFRHQESHPRNSSQMGFRLGD